jgi:integrase
LKAIDSALVLQTLLPVYERTPETGSRVRGRVERIFAWCKTHKLFDGENPAARDVLQDALPRRVAVRHHPALAFAAVPEFMAQLRQRDCVSARCLEFCVLTGVRTTEAIGATWDEIDFTTAVWSIPGHRMKGNRPHTVPLSARALSILKAYYRPGVNGPIFINGGGRPLSNQAMSELLKGMVPPERATVHGFRSSFRDWTAEQTDFDNHIAEAALAHVIKNKTEAAYWRGNLLDKRRNLMDAWSAYCCGE